MPGSSLLARGILALIIILIVALRITHAYAGSTTWSSSQSLSAGDHPRLRGEYIFEVGLIGREQGSSPLARGIRRSVIYYLCWMRIIPACAGSTILSFRVDLRNQGSPPLARGVRKANQSNKITKGITPACAGSTISKKLYLTLKQDHPRLRGEYTKKSLYLRDPCFLS